RRAHHVVAQARGFDRRELEVRHRDPAAVGRWVGNEGGDVAGLHASSHYREVRRGRETGCRLAIPEDVTVRAALRGEETLARREIAGARGEGNCGRTSGDLGERRTEGDDE